MKRINIKRWEKLTGVKITTDHSGKMGGMQSLSTSALVNPYCIERCKNNDTICAHCYARRQLNARPSQNSRYVKNAHILTSTVFDVAPIINALYFRFEAFGDLINETQFVNYVNIATANPRVTFALWTKNAFIIDNAVKAGAVIPSNMILIYSNAFIDKWHGVPFGFDKVFNVWTSEKMVNDASFGDCGINCGAHNCTECLRCYDKNDDMIINELLK